MFQVKNKLTFYKIIAVICVIALLKLFTDYYLSSSFFSPTAQEKADEDFNGLFYPLTYTVNIDVSDNKTYTVFENITSKGKLLYKNIPLTNLDNNKLLIRNASILNYPYRRNQFGNTLKLRPKQLGYIPNVQYTYDIYYKLFSPDDHTKDYDFFNIILFDSSLRLNIHKNKPYEQLSIKLNMPKAFDSSSVQLTDMYGNVLTNLKPNFIQHGHSLTITLDDNVTFSDGLAISARLPEGYFSRNWIYILFAQKLWLVILIAVLCLSSVCWLLLEKAKNIAPVRTHEPVKYLNPIETGFLYHQHTKPSIITSLIIYWSTKGILTLETTSDWKIYLSRHKTLPNNHRHYESLLFSQIFNKNTPIVTLQKLKPNFYKVIRTIEKSLYSYMTSENKGLFKSNRILTKTIIKCSIGIHLALLFGLYLINGVTFWSIVIIIFNLVLVWGIYTISVNAAVFLSQINDSLQTAKRQSLLIQFIKAFSLLCCFSLLSVIKICGAFTISSLAEIICWIGITLLINLHLRCNSLTSKGLDYLAQIRGLREFMLFSTKEELEDIQKEDPDYMIRMIPYTLTLDVSDVWFEKISLFDLEQPKWYTTLWGNADWTLHLKEICTYIQYDLIHPFTKKAPNYLFEETFNGLVKEVLLKIWFPKHRY